jgi:hypothetical protein
MTDDELKQLLIEADVGLEITPALRKFAELIVMAEREACARVCDAHTAESGLNNYGCEDCGGVAAEYSASAIRAR